MTREEWMPDEFLAWAKTQRDHAQVLVPVPAPASPSGVPQYTYRTLIEVLVEEVLWWRAQDAQRQATAAQNAALLNDLPYLKARVAILELP